MRDFSVKKLTFAGLMAALICVLTMFPHLPIPAGSGYVHLGDGMILLAAMVVGPMAIPAAAVGSALADLFSGFALYAPATFSIKGLVALIAWLLYRKGSILRTVVAFLLAEAAMVAGYFVFEWFVARDYAVVDIIGNTIQGVSGVALGVAFTYAVPQLERALK
ncbi:MAG: ECF transporter S component [Clostridiales bacterium]|nr:ECF transporter S component [Clostridiales bacterium]